MKRSHALALSAMTLFLASSASSQAQAVRSGQQCQPAVANASMYGNCRLRIVQGQEVCRCAILPRAQRLLNLNDRRDSATGSITSRGVPSSGSVSNAGSNAIGIGAASSGTGRAGSAGGATSSGSSGGNSLGGAVAGDVSGGASVGGGSAGGGTGSGRSGGAAGPSSNGNGQGPGNNNGLGNGSEPADNTSSDVPGTDPSNPGGGNGNAGAGGRGGDSNDSRGGGNAGGHGNGGGNDGGRR